MAFPFPGVCESTGQGGMPLSIFVIGIVRVMARRAPVRCDQVAAGRLARPVARLLNFIG